MLPYNIPRKADIHGLLELTVEQVLQNLEADKNQSLVRVSPESRDDSYIGSPIVGAPSMLLLGLPHDWCSAYENAQPFNLGGVNLRIEEVHDLDYDVVVCRWFAYLVALLAGDCETSSCKTPPDVVSALDLEDYLLSALALKAIQVMLSRGWFRDCSTDRSPWLGMSDEWFE